MGDALLDVIFDPDVADGAGLVIDGFPRTALQAHTALPDPYHHNMQTVVPPAHTCSGASCLLLQGGNVMRDRLSCHAQADFLKLLYDKLTELHMAHADTSDEWKYPLPSFKARLLHRKCAGKRPMSTCAWKGMLSVAPLVVCL